MNATEAITLCRFVKGACPQQAIDEYTPDAWALILADYRFEDCQQAALELVQANPFVAPAEIIAKVKAIRGKRIAEFGPIEPTEDEARAIEAGELSWRDWHIATRSAIGDGTLKPPPRREIDRAEQAKVQRAIQGTFRRIEDAADHKLKPPAPVVAEAEESK